MFKKKYNTFYKKDGYMVCVRDDGTEFIFDEEEYDKVKDICWRCQRNSVYGTLKRKTISFPRFILGITEKNRHVLRINNKIMDYRKSNLFFGNTYKEFDEYYEGTCFSGDKFKIDKEDLSLISPYVWHVNKDGYLTTKLKDDKHGTGIRMHRLILGLHITDEIEVDHINHDTLDNRKQNLRLANRFQNCMNTRAPKNNTSGVKGVYKPKGYDKWIAQINANGMRHYIGAYKTFDEAVSARISAEKSMHKEFACK